MKKEKKETKTFNERKLEAVSNKRAFIRSLTNKKRIKIKKSATDDFNFTFIRYILYIYINTCDIKDAVIYYRAAAIDKNRTSILNIYKNTKAYKTSTAIQRTLV